MKFITYVWLATAMLAGSFIGAAAQSSQSQPLGDYARTVRKDKEKDQKPTAAKKYDNDNLPVNDKLSIVGNAPADEPSANAGVATAEPGKDAPKVDDAAARQKSVDDWKNKIAAQRNQIELLSRELDVAQREYRLRAAAMYADAGNRLRSESTWDKEDAQYKQQIAQKQKGVDDAKARLDAMQEEARKAGVPARARE